MKHSYLVLFLLLAVLESSAQAPATTQSSTLYAHEFVLQTMPRRVLHTSIYDRGSATEGQGVARPRYVACVRYSTVESSGTYMGATIEGGCAAQPGQVTASVELAQLSRELFVDKLLLALKPDKLMQAGTAATLAWQAAQTELTSKKRSASIAADSLAAADKSLRKADTDQKAAPNNAVLLAKQNQAVATRTKAAKSLADALVELKNAEQTLQDAQKATQLVDSNGVLKKENPDILNLNPRTDEEKMVHDVLLDAYLDFVRQQEQYFTAPKAGVVEMAAQVPLYFGTMREINEDTAKRVGTLYPDSLQMEIEDGQITELKTIGGVESDGKKTKLHFETYAPIGISADMDLNNAWKKQILWNQAIKRGSHYIWLDDLLRYYPALSPRAGDRSPANGVYIIKPNDPLPKRTLTKVTTTKILQGRVYTDLAGVSGDKPNGLVQLEVDKKFVFGSSWSKRRRYAQYRLLGYFQPFVAVNKVEEQNRYLPLRRAPNSSYRYTVSSIDLLRYTNLRIGSDLNLLSVRFPRFISDVSLDAGVSLNRVDIRDSVYRVGTSRLVRVDSTLNVVSYGLSLKTRTRPDSRYGIQSRVGFYRYVLLNNYDQDNNLLIHQTPDPQGLNANAHTLVTRFWYQGVVQYELLGWVRLSEHSELFVRPQFSHLLYQAHRSFFQFQVGWQFDVFSNDREAPPTPANMFPGSR